MIDHDDHTACASPSPEWQRGFSAGMKVGEDKARSEAREAGRLAALAPVAPAGGVVDNWIAVSERLPDQRVNVLISTPWEDEAMLAWIGSDGRWTSHDDYGDKEYHKPTHWQPLPPTPSRDQEQA